METTTESHEPEFSNVSLFKIRAEAAVKDEEKRWIKASSSPIQFIVELIGKHNKSSSTQYNRLPEIADWNSGGFTVVTYQAREITLSSLSCVLQKRLGNEQDFGGLTEHVLVFLSKQVNQQWELFALTNNAAWKVVKRYSDASFPLRLAKRLIEPHFLSLTNRSLAGPELSSDTAFKVTDEYALARHEMDSCWRIFKNFRSHIKYPSSMYELSIFNEAPPRKKQRSSGGGGKRAPERVGVDVRGTSVLIARPFSMIDYQELIDHFGKIGRGEQTFVQGKPEEDDCTFSSLDNIERIEDPELKKRLEEILIYEVWRGVGGKATGTQISFCPPRYRDYYRASQITLSYKKHSKSFYYPPSYEEILQWIRERLENTLVTTPSIFTRHFKQMKLSFGGDRRCYTFATCFQGEFSYQGRLYFRIDGMWLKVTSEHQAVLERDFHELIATANLKLGLPMPWVAKSKWARFSSEELPASMSVEAVAELEGATFSFVDEQGVVQIPYATRCLLKEGKYGDRIKNSWEALNALLKAYEGQCLSEEQLAAIFPTSRNQQDREAQAKELLSLLKQVRPLAVTERTFDRVPIIGDNDEILEPNIDKFDWSSESPAFQKRLSGNQQILVKLCQEGKPLYKIDTTQSILNFSTPPSSTSFVTERVPALKIQGDIKTLKAGAKVQGPTYYTLHGPTTSLRLLDESTRKVLDHYHDLYRQINEEKGYNRLYLNRPGYLVLDQVYGGKAETVELFDILNWINGGELFLYHVKSGFGQKTRDACSQIRNAAQQLRGMIDGSDYSTLQRICQNVLKEGETSFYRREVKNKFEALPGEGTPTERFISLFQSRATERGSICFVYAFLDDAADERILARDGNPGYCFQKADFASLDQGDGLLALLQKEKLLDSRGRLTTTFFNCTAEAFTKSTKEHTADTERLRTLLRAKQSRFQSVIAKVELLQLQREIEHHGFSFKICQISRHGTPQPTLGLPAPDPLFYDQALPPLLSSSEDEIDSTGESNLANLETQPSPTPQLDVGFQNTNNTCFASCLLQILTTTPFALDLSSKVDGWVQNTSDTPADQWHRALGGIQNKYSKALTSGNSIPSTDVNKLLQLTVQWKGGHWDNGAFHDFLDLYTLFSERLGLAKTNTEPYLPFNTYKRSCLLQDSIQTFLNDEYAQLPSSQALAVGIARRGDEMEINAHPVLVDEEVAVGSDKYELVALVIHEDNHFITYKQASRDRNRWVACDDGRIMPSSLTEIQGAVGSTVIFTLYTKVSP